MAEGFLLLDEVAGLARVSVDTVRFWIRAGKLASVRPGRRRMVRREVLDAFLRQDSLVTKHDVRSVQESPPQVADSQAMPDFAPVTSEGDVTDVAPNELERRRASEACRRLGLRP